MSTPRIVLVLLLFAILGTACDRAAELIPGETDDEPGAVATPGGDSLPITVPTTIRVPGGIQSSVVVDAVPDVDLAQSVVQIIAFDSDTPSRRVVRSGSGVVVDSEQRLILTSLHVVEPFGADGSRLSSQIGIGVNRVPATGPTLEYEADVLLIDLTAGLAILRVTAPFDGEADEAFNFNLSAVELGDSTQLRRGDALRLFGHAGVQADGALVPLEQVVAVTNASVAGFRGSAAIDGRAWVKTDARLPFGSAGGPAFDATGRLVGVLTQLAYGSDAPTAQLHPLRLAIDLIEEAQAGGAVVGRPLVRRATAPGTALSVTASGVYVSQPAFAENALENEGDRDLFDYSLQFPSELPELHYEFAAQGIQEGALIQELWYLDGVVQDELSSSYTWSLGDFAIVTDRLSSPNPRGNPDGQWRLEVWVDGELRAANTAYVGVEPPSPAVGTWDFSSGAGAGGGPAGVPFGAAGQILGFFNYEGAGAVEHVRWIVFHDGRIVYQSSNVPWEGGNSGTWWVGFSSETSVGPGEWEFEVYFDNRLASAGGTQLF